MPLDLDVLKADVTELLARFMHGHYYIVEGVTPREKPLSTIRTLETCVTLLDELTEARRTLERIRAMLREMRAEHQELVSADFLTETLNDDPAPVTPGAAKED